jgi:hypothetical protein
MLFHSFDYHANPARNTTSLRAGYSTVPLLARTQTGEQVNTNQRKDVLFSKVS